MSRRYEEILGRVIVERREVTKLERARAECERLASPEHQRAELAERYAELERRRADLGDHERHVRSRDEVRRTRYAVEGKELDGVLHLYRAGIEQRLMALGNLASKARLPVPTTVYAAESEARSVDQAMRQASIALERADGLGRQVGRGGREPALHKWPPLLRNLAIYGPAGLATLVILALLHGMAAVVPGLAGSLVLIALLLPAAIAGAAIFLRDWLMSPPMTREPGKRDAGLAFACCYVGMLLYQLTIGS